MKNFWYLRLLVTVSVLLCSLCGCPFVYAAVQSAPHSNTPSNPPVVVPDVPKLPWTLENGVKVFRLTSEVVQRELLPASSMGPAKVVTLWGYNGSVPGPTIEVNEGDRVRVIFKNNLPEDTTVHWHGLEIPIDMDGVPFISQPLVKPGGTFVYEFTLNQNGTFFYHSHGAMQEMMGMIGFFIIHPKKPNLPACQKDFGIVLQEFAVLPNNPIPNSMSMEFNWLTFNGKSAPATTPMIVRQGDRVRIRFINIGMDHHPIHLHGNQFYITGTEGGRIPKSAWFPSNTMVVGVAQGRDIEFDAIHPGDWMLHCHMPHHMMNNMASMVGPIAHLGQGLHTGMSMEAGMGIVTQGSATDEDLAPGFGRGMGVTADRERPLSSSIGRTELQQQTAATQGMQDHEGMQGMSAGPSAPNGKQPNVGMSPGYPQDALMMMPMDAAVAKPQTNGLKPGWSGALQGMMNLVRVLPPAQYDKLVSDIRAGRVEASVDMPMDHGGMNMPAGTQMDHSQMNMPGMDHSKMNMPAKKPGEPEMDHSKMNMPGMDHSKIQIPAKKQGTQKMPAMDHSKMKMPAKKQSKQKTPAMDHSKMKMPGMDHSKMNMPAKKQSKQKAPAMDHSKMKMPGMDHSKMNMPAKQQSKQKTPAMDHSKMNMPGMDHSK